MEVYTDKHVPADDLVSQFIGGLTALSGHIYQTKNVTKDIIEFLKTREINKIHLEPKTLDENLCEKQT